MADALGQLDAAGIHLFASMKWLTMSAEVDQYAYYLSKYAVCVNVNC